MPVGPRCASAAAPQSSHARRRLQCLVSQTAVISCRVVRAVGQLRRPNMIAQDASATTQFGVIRTEELHSSFRVASKTVVSTTRSGVFHGPRLACVLTSPGSGSCGSWSHARASGCSCSSHVSLVQQHRWTSAPQPSHCSDRQLHFLLVSGGMGLLDEPPSRSTLWGGRRRAEARLTFTRVRN